MLVTHSSLTPVACSHIPHQGHSQQLKKETKLCWLTCGLSNLSGSTLPTNTLYGFLNQATRLVGLVHHPRSARIWYRCHSKLLTETISLVHPKSLPVHLLLLSPLQEPNPGQLMEAARGSQRLRSGAAAPGISVSASSLARRPRSVDNVQTRPDSCSFRSAHSAGISTAWVTNAVGSWNHWHGSTELPIWSTWINHH